VKAGAHTDAAHAKGGTYHSALACWAHRLHCGEGEPEPVTALSIGLWANPNYRFVVTPDGFSNRRRTGDEDSGTLES